jgi:multidrug efflux pump subunit AcrB
MATKTDNKGGPIRYMARNPIAANLLMILLIGGGVWSMYTVQKEVFPQFQLDIVDVSEVYPGSSPAEVEQGILLPVEEAIRGVQGIKEVTSTAREGAGSISIELVAGTNRMKAFQDIDQAVNRIRTFPDDIEEPEVTLQARQRDVIEIGLFGDTDIWTLRKLAERLRDRLLSEPGITQVEMGNIPDYVTHVEIPRHQLRKYNLTLGQVANLIQQSSMDIPAGSVETERGEILLRVQERKQWAEEFANIAVVADSTGARVRLGEIASIRDGFEETGFHSQFNEQPSVEVQVFRIGNQSPLDIAQTVQRTLEDFGQTLPQGVQTRIDGNRADDYRQRLALLTENGMLAIFIVLFILGLFLEYRLAFWVMMGMTISFVGGIFFLPVFGLSINMISMFGFLVVLGIVVDDVVVVGENIYEYREQGMSYMQAAIQGTKDMARPVTFSILTNIIAFIPLLFIPGTTGKFWAPLPAVVIIVLAISLMEALFILPAHLAHSSKGNRFKLGVYADRAQQAVAKRFKKFVERYYRPFLRKCLQYRYLTLSSALGVAQ